MKYRRIKWTLHLSLFGSAALLMAWSARQWRLAEEAQAEVRGLARTRAELEGRAEVLKGRLKSREAELRTPAPSTRAPQPPVPPLRRESQDGTGGRPPGELADDPVLQKLYLEMERAGLAGRYAALVKLLDLDPDEAMRLEELIFQRNERRLDLDGAALLLRLEGREPALVRARDEAAAAFRAGFVDRFGERAFDLFDEYERALPVWEFVNRFAGAVALEGAPLTPSQAVRLTETVAAASPPYQAGGIADPDQVDWPAAWAGAETMLSEPQHLAFLNMAPIYRVTQPGGTGLPRR